MLDTDVPTLHIRCGSDIRDTLRQAGFGGDFLAYWRIRSALHGPGA